MFDEAASGFQSTIQKDRTGYSFENVGQQSILPPTTTLFFTAPKAQEFTKPQLCRGFRQCWRAYQTVLHPRQLTFARMRISLEEIVGDDQSEHRIAKELQRFVVQVARIFLRPRRNLFMRPRAMRHRLRE